VHSRTFFSWTAWKQEHKSACTDIFFSPFTCVFLLCRLETALSMDMQTFFLRFSLVPLGNSTKYGHADIFSAFFSCTTWASGNLALLCIHWRFAVQHRFFETPTTNMCSDFCSYSNPTTCICKSLSRLYYFLHVSKSVVIILLTCQLDKCLEKGKLRMSSCFWLHKRLEKIFV